jgi:hypothetical protein
VRVAKAGAIKPPSHPANRPKNGAVFISSSSFEAIMNGEPVQRGLWSYHHNKPAEFVTEFTIY